jgi:membrane-associated phospholipid phosphatase
VFTILFVVAVMVARVSINAHYPSDVLGGFLAGIGVIALFALLSRPKPSGR